MRAARRVFGTDVDCVCPVPNFFESVRDAVDGTPKRNTRAGERQAGK